MNKNNNLVICDLDGTLLNSSGELSSNTIRYFKTYLSQGNDFVVATGRSIHATQVVIEGLELEKYSPYIITDNGACIHNFVNGKLNKINQVYISKDIVEVMNGEIYKYYEDIFFYNKGQLSKYKDKNQIVSKENRHYEISDGADTSRLFIYAKYEDIVLHIDKLRATFESFDVNVYHSMDDLIEISPKSCSKGKALMEVARLNHFNLELAYAFGDSENDVSMLNVVGNPVKMKNCVGAISEIDFPSCRTNDEDGLISYLNERIKLL